MASDDPQSGGEEQTDEEFVYRAVLETDQPEILSTLLTTLDGWLGTEVVDRETDAETVEAEKRHPPGTVIAYFRSDTPDAALRIQDRITREIVEGASFAIDIHECNLYTDESWKESWKEFFTPIAIAPNAWVGPPWEEEATRENAGRDGTAFIVDPGMAFGTGHHETTRLTGHLLADALAEFDAPPSVLDVGCGSGVLSMLAADAGAHPVVGVDISDDAVAAARENAARNGFEDLDFSTRDLADVPGTFDLVVANILDEILLYLRDDLYDHVAPGGRLLVSGIPDERLEHFREAFILSEWCTTTAKSEGGWHAFNLRRRRS